jgi:hypothetical protein
MSNYRENAIDAMLAIVIKTGNPPASAIKDIERFVDAVIEAAVERISDMNNERPDYDW